MAFGGAREECHALAVRYLAEAVKLGRPAQTFATNPVFRQHLCDRPDFRKLFELPSAASPVVAPDPHLAPPPLD
jgi:hypothetical protein